MEVQFRNSEQAKRVELTYDADRSGSKSVVLPLSKADELLADDEISIKKIHVRRQYGDDEATLIDDYLLAGFSKKQYKPKYRFTVRNGTLRIYEKSRTITVFSVLEEVLKIKNNFELVLDGPSEELDHLLSGEDDFIRRKQKAAQKAEKLSESFRNKAREAELFGQDLEEMSFNEFKEEHDGEYHG